MPNNEMLNRTFGASRSGIRIPGLRPRLSWSAPSALWIWPSLVQKSVARHCPAP